MSFDFKKIGLLCDPVRTRINGVLRYEWPVNLTSDCQFDGTVALGAFTYINGPTVLNEVTVGRYCSIADGVVFGPGQHHTEYFSTHPFVYDPEDNTAHLSCFPEYARILGRTPPVAHDHVAKTDVTGPIQVGCDVWIGMRAIIMQGVSIGHGAVIAAGAIVTRDVEPYAIVAGVPAKTVRRRFDQATVDRLLASHWWDFDLGDISNHVNYGDPASVLDRIELKQRDGTLRAFTPKVIELRKNATGISAVQVPSLSP